MIWPKEVYVLEKGRDTLIYPSPPGADGDNKPRSAESWGESELRTKEVLSNNNYASIDLMIGVWRYRFYELLYLQAKYRDTYSIHDVYNAAWAACGYQHNQCRKALKLCDMRFNPYQK